VFSDQLVFILAMKDLCNDLSVQSIN
jgi:hypothetical protein